jgi:hypothetical protein
LKFSQERSHGEGEKMVTIIEQVGIHSTIRLSAYSIITY